MVHLVGLHYTNISRCTVLKISKSFNASFLEDECLGTLITADRRIRHGDEFFFFFCKFPYIVPKNPAKVSFLLRAKLQTIKVKYMRTYVL